ncbi:l1 transposable element-related [Holotrichia oblita]|uniref:L1 transposable element-related n=1 Tax=Holotrichia oblita TaxID=644536 RepID=A0ACB9TIE3_HOLOL|nr:l1 transposable element-related [Holotrichia oblita]
MPFPERVTRSSAEDDVLIKKVVEKVLGSDILRKELISKIQCDIVAEYSKEVQVLTEKVVQLEAELIATRSEVRKSVDDLEQYSRRNNLRIFGVPEEANEDTKVLVSKFCKDKLKLNVGPELMDACHRLPAKEQQQRPIIVKFHDRATKANVCSRKQELRGTKFVIREDLTRTRHLLMVEAKKSMVIDRCGQTTVRYLLK